MDMGLPKGLDRPLATPRRLDAADRERFESYLSEILRGLGMNLSEDGTRGTQHHVPPFFGAAWVTQTVAWRGDYETSESLRRDFLSLLAPG